MPATYSVGSRVRVTDQSNWWRGQTGAVMQVVSLTGNGSYNVRTDGMGTSQTLNFNGTQLAMSTIADPLKYPDGY